jgi:aspartyl-tRNA(Asn)/glutamyl-tRNA(Gln) amidotransferase subunit A
LRCCSSRARSSSGSCISISTDGIVLAAPAVPRDGIPLAVKDIFDTAGLTTTYGSLLFADHVPARSAEAVRRCEAAGFAVHSKTNLHEFAYGTTSQNQWYGTVPNPRAPDRTAGGSSGGSAAAIAAGLVRHALGTDSGGSIRIPAACCGVTGFKPSYGLVPLDGVFPLAASFDHAGPLGADVQACVELMQALVPGLTPHGEPGRVAVAWSDEASPAIQEALARAAALLDAEPIAFPFPGEDVYPLFEREVAQSHAGLFPEQAELYGENVRVKLEHCLTVGEAAATRAAAARERYRGAAEDALAGFDLLLMPTLAITPPPADVDEREIRGMLIRLTFPFNALGWPALALPAGEDGRGAPLSVQLVGRNGADERVLAAGALLERELSPV